MEYYFLIALSGILLACDFVVTKAYQTKFGASPRAVLVFNALNGFITAVVFFFINGFSNGFGFDLTPFSAIMATAAVLCAILYTLVGFRMLKGGTMAMYTIFLMVGGMVMPYLYGLIFLGEAATLLRIIGVVVMIGAVVVCNLQGRIKASSMIVLGIAVFLLNGGLSIVSKQHQIDSGFATVGVESFVVLTGIAKFAISAVALIFVKKGKEDGAKGDLLKPSILARAIPWVAASAVFSGVSYLLQLIGAGNLPASVLYPMVTGGSIVFSSLAGRIVYKDKLTWQQYVGMGLCVAGTCLFLEF